MDFHVIAPEAAELVMQVIDGELVIVPPVPTAVRSLPLLESDRLGAAPDNASCAAALSAREGLSPGGCRAPPLQWLQPERRGSHRRSRLHR